MTTAEARGTLLMGSGGSWNGYGGRKISDAPTEILTSARRWFREKQSEHPRSHIAAQIEAIALVLEERERNSPQQRLPL